MITAITFHAIDRLQERRKLEHLVRHINKIRKWNLPETGETEHKGYRYITRGGGADNGATTDKKSKKNV